MVWFGLVRSGLVQFGNARFWWCLDGHRIGENLHGPLEILAAHFQAECCWFNSARYLFFGLRHRSRGVDAGIGAAAVSPEPTAGCDAW
jgi:hypothetical protein